MTTIETDTLSDLLAPAITDLLVGDSPAQRVEAVRRLGRIQSKFAVTYLVQSLLDIDPEVRLAIVEALGEIDDPAAIEPLSELLDRETSPLFNRDTLLQTIDKLRLTKAGEISTSATPPSPPVIESSPETEFAQTPSSKRVEPTDIEFSTQAEPPADADHRLTKAGAVLGLATAPSAVVE